MVDSNNGEDTFFQEGGTFREGCTVSLSRCVYSMDVDVKGPPALGVQAPESLGVKEQIGGSCSYPLSELPEEISRVLTSFLM